METRTYVPEACLEVDEWHRNSLLQRQQVMELIGVGVSDKVSSIQQHRRAQEKLMNMLGGVGEVKEHRSECTTVGDLQPTPARNDG